MKTIGVTLARGGSKGIPNKNIKMCAGKPLLVWTIEEALKSERLDYYVVSTDSEKIAKVAAKAGADVVIRPEELAGDRTPAIDALLHALDFVEARYDGPFDILADLRATNPFKTAEDIDGAIQKLIRTDADVVAGVSQLEDHHPSRIKMIHNDTLVDVWPEPADGNRQSLKPDVYIRNGSIYICKSEALRNGIHFTGSDAIRPWVMPLEKSVNIDTPLDFVVAEQLLEKRKEAPKEEPKLWFEE